MNESISTTGVLITIALILILAFIIYKIIKPYIIKYDSTLLFTGGLGSGKTLNSVKMVIKLYRKQYIFAYKLANLKIKIKNKFRKKDNKIPLRKPPLIYSNIPLMYKKHLWSIYRIPAVKLEQEHLLLLKEIREYSIVFIDELPQFVNQFNWDQELIQNNVNEFITFFRHYVGGYFVTNGQSESDIVVQVRRKLNSCIWCRNFSTHLFKTIYTCECITLNMSDNVTNVNQTQLEENSQKCFGILLGMSKTYNTRCYKPRYENCLINERNTKNQDLNKRFPTNTLETTEVLRLVESVSPLDNKTTDIQKQRMLDKAKALKSNKEQKQ